MSLKQGLLCVCFITHDHTIAIPRAAGEGRSRVRRTHTTVDSAPHCTQEEEASSDREGVLSRLLGKLGWDKAHQPILVCSGLIHSSLVCTSSQKRAQGNSCSGAQSLPCFHGRVKGRYQKDHLPPYLPHNSMSRFCPLP